MEKIKNNFKVVGASALIVMAVLGTIAYEQFGDKAVEEAGSNLPKSVKVASLQTLSSGDTLEIEGTVKPANKVDVVALANGTIKSLNFKVGDKVEMNQQLAYVSDTALATNYANSSLNYSNISQNVNLTKTLTDEGIRQSGLGVDRAKEMLDQAQISLDTAKQNLANAKSLQEKNKEDLKSNALVSYNSYLNAANGFLDQANFIIKAEGSSQLDGISDTLSVKNPQALTSAKNAYLEARDSYNLQIQKNYSANDVASAVKASIALLNQTKKVIDLTVQVLDGTISSARFSEGALNAQRSSFVSIRGNVVSTLSAAQGTLQMLQNIDLVNKKDLDGLAAVVRSAENQLNQARIGYDNAQLVLNNSKQSQNQQLLLSKSSLDNARGQLNLIGTQLSDLSVKAPIAGQITAKLVDLGAEVRIGQKLGEVSQTNMVKIVLNVSPDDVGLIKLGQKAMVNGSLPGTVSNINPNADLNTKKVAVEVVVENKAKLMPETLAKVTFSIKDNPRAKQQYKIPLAALTVAQNENYIFIAGDKTAKKIAVELLEIDGDWALVRIGVPGDVKVVIEGNKNLSDGDIIEIK
jgi:RND family efflux transporter MFP subunit